MYTSSKYEEIDTDNSNNSLLIAILNSTIATDEKLMKISSDVDLLNYALQLKYDKDKTQHSYFCKHLAHKLANEDALPSLHYELLQKDRFKAILILSKQQQSLNNGVILEYACNYFGLSLLIIHINNKSYEVKKFGNNTNFMISAILKDNSYYVTKPSSINTTNDTIKKIVEKNKIYCKIDNKSVHQRKDSNDKFKTVYKNFTNSYHMLKDKQVANCIKDQQLELIKKKNMKIEPKIEFKKFNDLKYPKTTNKNYKQVTKELEQSDRNIKKHNVNNIDNDTIIDNNLINNMNDYKFTHFDSNNVNENLFMSKKIDNDKMIAFRNENKYDEKFNQALNFIQFYQSMANNKSMIINNTKGYKPLVYSKSNEYVIGKLKFYKHDNKFGFILYDNYEIFLHKDNLIRSKIDSIAFENCSKFFDILLKFKTLHYKGKNSNKTKAVEIEIMNFIPKARLTN